jgi:uncharacterized membrane protein YidH (DUF202 family)
MGLTMTGYNMLFVFLDFIGFASKVTQYLVFQRYEIILEGESPLSYRNVLLVAAYLSEIVMLTFMYIVFMTWKPVPVDLTTMS